MKKFAFKKGFTLIELLIVITIIGILAAALLPSIIGAPARARDATRVADIGQIVTALEAYASDHNGSYPNGLGGGAGAWCVSSIAGLDAYFTGGEIPSDPTDADAAGLCTGGYAYCPVDAPYNYVLVAANETNGGQANFAEAEVNTLVDCGNGTDTWPVAETDANNEVYAVAK